MCQDESSPADLPVCVDLDGTLAIEKRWRELGPIGHPFPGAKHFLEELRENARVIIHTVRCNSAIRHGYSAETMKCLVEEWLNKHELPYDEIYSGAGKPVAVAYIDDRAIACNPASDDFAYHRALLEFRDLLRDREGRR